MGNEQKILADTFQSQDRGGAVIVPPAGALGLQNIAGAWKQVNPDGSTSAVAGGGAAFGWVANEVSYMASVAGLQAMANLPIHWPLATGVGWTKGGFTLDTAAGGSGGSYVPSGTAAQFGATNELQIIQPKVEPWYVACNFKLAAGYTNGFFVNFMQLTNVAANRFAELTSQPAVDQHTYIYCQDAGALSKLDCGALSVPGSAALPFGTWLSARLYFDGTSVTAMFAGGAQTMTASFTGANLNNFPTQGLTLQNYGTDVAAGYRIRAMLLATG